MSVEAVKNTNDIAAISSLLLKHGSQDYQDIWRLGLNVAFRISDLLSIETTKIDLVKRELTLTEGKTKKLRTVRLNKTAIEIINNRMEKYPDDIYLFQSPAFRLQGVHRPISRSTVARKFQEVGEILDIRLGTHSMRKTRGYAMHQAGVSIEQICKVLNHSSPAVTMHYIGISKEETMQTYDDFEL